WVQYASQSITTTGLSPNTTYRFRVQARNQYGYTTGWYPAEDPSPQYVEFTTTGGGFTCGNTFGDINGDTYINGDDIGGFVRAKLGLVMEEGEDEYCAHYGENTDQEDIEDFILLLLN
ncbi:MAG: fibronectin type III domain-containing protein, partial [Planctomycetes bacterium]|nr:fibronectin type III domain-containing protein [Planctomycetota bacterium]